MLKSIGSFLAVLLTMTMAFGLIACGSTATLITNLELVSAAATAAIPVILATTGMPLDPATKAKIVAYLTDVNTAVVSTGTELESTDTAEVKAAKIVGYFSAAVLPDLPSGTPQAVATVINAVAAAVTIFLAQIQPPPAPPASAGAVKVAPLLTKAIPSSLNEKSKATLTKAVAEANKNLLALKK